MTAVVPLTMVVVGSKQPLNHHRPRPPHMGHCKSRQQPCKTNRCNAEPPTRTTYGTTRPYQTLHRSYQLTNGVSLHSTSRDTYTNPLPANGVGSPHNFRAAMNYMYMYQGKSSHTCPLPTLPVELHVLALTANGLTCTCKQNPIGPAPSPPHPHY